MLGIWRNGLVKQGSGLKKNYEFKKVYNHGKSFADSYLVMFILKNNLGINKVGFSVSKKVGKSVIRNRVKRRLKENYRLSHSKLKIGYNIIFLSRVRANEADYNTLSNSMNKLFKKADLIKKQ